MKKGYIYTITVVIVIVAIGLLIYRTKETNNNFDIFNSLGSPIPTPTATLAPSQTVKPTPGIIIQDENLDYQYWAKKLDPLNRYLALDKDCTSIIPSQIDYPNNTQIMIDNTISDKARILKIGKGEYPISAHGWILITLRSNTLPAQFPIFCGNMELGRLDLLAQ
jgi:hypothetical protein